MINKIKELQDKFKWLSKRTDLQSKQINQDNPVTRGSTALVPINTTCLDCDTSLEICTCMDDTIDMKKTLMTFVTDERTYSKKEVFELIRKAFEAGYKKYEVVEAGLEGLETDVECNWILKKYGKND